MKKIIWIFILYSYSINAQTSDWKFFSISANVENIAEEGNYLWIGGITGVTKIDKITGTQIRYNKTTCPIPDNWVNKIVIDTNGIKWFATQFSGIIRFDGTNWNQYDTSIAAIPYSTIRDIDVDAKNNIWACTNYTLGGLIKYNGTSWTNINTANSGLPSNHVYCIYSDVDTLWVSTSLGLAKYDGSSWTIYNTSNSNISSHYINEIKKDKLGNIWLMHNNSIEKFNGTSFSLFPNPSSATTNYSIALDTLNSVWIGYSGSTVPFNIGGVMSFNGNSWTQYNSTNSPFADETGTVHVDGSNNLWIAGAYSDKLFKKNGTSWSDFKISNSMLNDNFIREIVFDKNSSAYIATNPSNLNDSSFQKYDWNGWAQAPYYETGKSLGIISDKYGNIYVKNPTEIQKYNGIGWAGIPNIPALTSFLPVYFSLNSITSDTLGNLWIDYLDNVTSVWNQGTTTYTAHEGLAYYNGVSWTTYSYQNSPLPDAPINFIKTDYNNNLWIALGAGYGLMKFDGTTWTNYKLSNSCIPNNINSFAIDSMNNIWFTDNNCDLIKFDGIGCTNYSQPSSCPGSACAFDIDGSLWSIGLNSLSRFDGTNWQVFDPKNSPIPLNTNTTSISIDKYGNKWLGTRLGLLIYRNGGVILSIPSVKDKESSIIAFPNPFINSYELKLNKRYDNLQLKMYDILSREIYSTTFKNADIINVPRNNLPSGVYLYQLTSNEKIIASGKIIAR